MILQGNQRGGAGDLARHLMSHENEHVDVYELRGFVSNDLKGAFKEAHAISKGTKAKQFLYSLSLNPPADQKVSTQTFHKTIDRIEQTLGLEGQPRAIVFHEKNGRRHAHAVWSRTDMKTMTAIPLPHTKRKLMEISKSLYIEHGWEMPKGMLNPEHANPKNFTLAQWQQAKRQGKDPRQIKQSIQDAYAISDNKASFVHALQERGFHLAKGDRRGFVAVDHRCEVYAISKWVGVKSKDVRAKLGDEAQLPNVKATKQKICVEMGETLETLKAKHVEAVHQRQSLVKKRYVRLTKDHRLERQQLTAMQATRAEKETIIRKSRFRRGFWGLWDHVCGRRHTIQKRNEQAALISFQRDQREKDDLIFQHLEKRKSFENRLDRLERLRRERSHKLDRDIEQYSDIKEEKQERFQIDQKKGHKLTM